MDGILLVNGIEVYFPEFDALDFDFEMEDSELVVAI
jgi:hypothetical protein